MDGLDHLTSKKIEGVCTELWKIRGALRGVGSVLQHQSSDLCYETDELFGLGQLFESLSEQIARQEDILQCGYDSMAINKDSNDEDGEVVEDTEDDDRVGNEPDQDS